MSGVARTRGVVLLGVDGHVIGVEAHVSIGVSGFSVVGLADKAVSESRERVQSALAAMGLALPPKRITINLSPADLPKEGSHYDLPIALALLGAMGLVDAEALAQFVVVGELGLDGRVAASPGVLLSRARSTCACGRHATTPKTPTAGWTTAPTVAAPEW